MKRVFLLLLACCLLIAPAAAAGGSGTAADPYIVQTAAELQSIQNNLAAYYRLANDIDLSGTWTSIGSSSAPFTGSLDGNGYEIIGLSNPFFNYLSGATITNLKIVNANVVQSRNMDGCSIVAKMVVGTTQTKLTDITITNSQLSSLSARNGLFIGYNNNGNVLLSNCDIINSKYINNGGSDLYDHGFLIGSNFGSSTITNCDVSNSIMDVDGNHCGLIGRVGWVTVGQTYNLNTVTNCIMIGASSGGFIIGYVVDSPLVSVTDCIVSDSTLRMSGQTGGIIAYSNSGQYTDCTIKDCSILGGYTLGIGYTSGDGIITDCSIENTNVFGGTIFPTTANPDDSNTATGITNVADRYLYASGLTAAPNGKTVSYTLEGRQGSTTIEAAQGTAQSWAWTFGDGQTSTAAQDTTHTYADPGTYSTSLTLKNYLESTGVTVTTSGYNILPIPPTVSASANVLQLGQSVTLNAAGTLFSTIQWEYSTNNGASWQDISGATTNNYVWTPEAGSYQVRAHVTAVGTGYTANSAVLTISVYAPPTISDISASPTVVTAWPQQITLSATVSDSGPDATTYQWQQQAIGTSTWQDISGATTATYTASQTINSATQYRLIATGTGGQTTSDTVWIYPKPTATVSAATGTPTTSITLSADKTYGATTIQWEYSTNGASTWQDITGATTATYSWTPQNAASYTVRADVTYGQYTLYSTYAAFAIYNPPSITAVTVSPTIGQYTETITLSAEVTDSGPDATTYQWQQSPQNQNTWTNIEGATTAQWIGQLTFAGATDFRLIATGTGGTTTSATTTYYIALPGEIQSLTATPSVVALPGSTTLSATGANVITWEWQELISGTWTTIGYGASLQESLTTEGTYTYRVLATGADGTTITSETVEVLAGYAPTVSITSPANNAELSAGNSVTAQATITGTDVVYQWSLGADGVGNLNTNPTTITYTSQGYKTITITAESIFGTATDSVTILYGKAPRPMQTELFDEVDTTPVTNFVNQFDVEPGEMPNPVGIVASLFAPFDDALKGFFWVLMFGAVMLVVWLISKNIAIPSVLGILFGSFMIGFMPDMYLYPAVALIAAGCAGGLVYVVRKN